MLPRRTHERRVWEAHTMLRHHYLDDLWPTMSAEWVRVGWVWAGRHDLSHLLRTGGNPCGLHDDCTWRHTHTWGTPWGVGHNNTLTIPIMHHGHLLLLLLLLW